MHIKESRTRKFGYAIIVLLTLNFIMGSLGAACREQSLAQTLLWQFSLASMIAGCVFMGAYVAERGWSFASGGFYLLGVAHGSFFASLKVDNFEPYVLARGVIIMIPAFIAIGMSRYLPTSLKWLSISICVPFLILYYMIMSGNEASYKLYIASFFYLSLVALCWAFHVWRQLQKEDREVV